MICSGPSMGLAAAGGAGENGAGGTPLGNGWRFTGGLAGTLEAAGGAKLPLGGWRFAGSARSAQVVTAATATVLPVRCMMAPVYFLISRTLRPGDPRLRSR